MATVFQGQRKLEGGRNEFYDSAVQYLENLRNDLTVSHVVIVTVNANDAEGNFKEEEVNGTITNPPVALYHNMPDTIDAAILINQIGAAVFMQEQNRPEETQTVQ